MQCCRQLPKLTPLQSRLLASIVATGLCIVIWISFQPHHFVYASELAPELPTGEYSYGTEDELSDARTDDGVQILGVLDDRGEAEGEGRLYEPEFAYFERSIIGRSAEGVNTLTNNVKYPLDIKSNDIAYFVFPRSQVTGKKGDPGAGLPTPLEDRSLPNEEEEVPDDPDGLCTGSGINDPSMMKRDGADTADPVDGVYKRQDGNRVYITINTCRQPVANTTANLNGDIPQLQLYVSTTTEKPGPRTNATDLVTPRISLQGGYASYNFSASTDVFIGVAAPEFTDPQNWDGNWHFEIAASVDRFYHTTSDDTFLFLVDTDSSSALFLTGNLTQDNNTETAKKWMEMPMPFTMYAFLEDNAGMKGLERSVCGLQDQFNKANIKVDSEMVTRGDLGLPKAQFHIQGLNASSKYYGYLAMKGNGTTDGVDVPGNAVVGGGGKVWQQFNWTTKSDRNCRIIFNLEFCSSIAHAVPANPFRYTAQELAKKYDDHAKDLYANFTKSLAQVACNTTGTALYSLARNCTDCANDYKNWLCTVLMPRCEDFSSHDPRLVPRNIDRPFFNGSKLDLDNPRNLSPFLGSTNTSTPQDNDDLPPEFKFDDRKLQTFTHPRNKKIDDDIQPGPYKELLPCDYLCNEIVRSCPAQLQFKCPEGRGRRRSYGKKDQNKRVITCSYPGATRDLNVLTTAGTSARGKMDRTAIVGVVVALLVSAVLV